MTEGGDVGQWITVRKFGPYAAGCDEELGEKGVRTVYLGYHDDGTKDRPHYGVMRLFVPVTVVKKAVDLATNETQVTTYGKVTVTAVQATDEPALSERAWRGWNLRTVGDATDSERRMYLSDATLKGDLGYGLSGALNNTADAHTIVEVDDDLKARACPPTIFSPTFGAEGGGRTGIGAVSFKARIYERPGEVAPPGRIVVWGASNNVDAKWTLIGTNEIVSTVFSNFTWTTGGSYSAIKFELASEGYRRGVVDTGRVILDEVLISEKVQPSITFDYARPFRMNLGTHKPIVDILSRDEQPLAGESWGVQTKLTLKQHPPPRLFADARPRGRRHIQVRPLFPDVCADGPPRLAPDGRAVLPGVVLRPQCEVVGRCLRSDADHAAHRRPPRLAPRPDVQP